jgi:hypothetical protein
MVYCSECGTENEENARFCSKCGAEIITDLGAIRRPVRRKQIFGLPSGIFIAVITLIIVLAGMSLIYSNFLSGTVTGSGKLITEEKDFSNFGAVNAEKGFNVEITQSTSYSIRITADENVINKIQVTKTGNTLNIGLKPGDYISLTLKAKITMPDLDELELSGGSHGKVEGFYNLDTIFLDLSGGSSVEMEGSAEDLILDASSGSHLSLGDFSVDIAEIELSGGSSGVINVSATLDADLSGGSHLEYFGDPELGDIEKSGGSSLKKR